MTHDITRGAIENHHKVRSFYITSLTSRSLDLSCPVPWFVELATTMLY